ncbi:MAG: cell division protein FtsZ [Candidatus Altiarchaeota archaeon]
MSNPLTVKVFGVGGGGGHTIEELSRLGADGLDVYAVNTDARVLLDTKTDKKILIGKELTGGTSTGSDSIMGDRCARYDMGKIAEAADDADIVFITCGLGGGTGSGASPVIAERAKTIGALTVAIVTLPFESEGRKALKNADTGLKTLKRTADAVIVIPNENLLENAQELPITEAFKLADSTVANIIKELSHLTAVGDVNDLSFADLRSILSEGRTTYVGVGVSEDFEESADEALSSRIIAADPNTCCGALAYFTFAEEEDAEKVEDALERISRRLPEDVGIIWGARRDETLPEKTCKTLLVLCQED